MIKIEIEIPKMPENCHVCPLKYYVKSEVDSGYFCYKTKHLIHKQSNERPQHCPLVEEKEKCDALVFDDGTCEGMCKSQQDDETAIKCQVCSKYYLSDEVKE